MTTLPLVRRELGVVLVAALHGLVALGCAGPEEDLVNRYLTAARSGDNQMIASLSMMAFPAEVVSWEVTEVVDSGVEPYRVPEMRQRVDAAEDERDAQFKEFGSFRQDHYDDLRTIQNRTRDEPDYRFGGTLGELQERWDAHREARREVVTKLHEAEIALEREIRQVAKSLLRESTPEYLTGQTEKKLVRVRVTTPAGEKRYGITLSRYELKNQFDAVVPSRWIITGVDEED